MTDGVEVNLSKWHPRPAKRFVMHKGNAKATNVNAEKSLAQSVLGHCTHVWGYCVRNLPDGSDQRRNRSTRCSASVPRKQGKRICPTG